MINLSNGILRCFINVCFVVENVDILKNFNYCIYIFCKNKVDLLIFDLCSFDFVFLKVLYLVNSN